MKRILLGALLVCLVAIPANAGINFPPWAAGSGGGTPAGSDQEIQINNGGSFGAITKVNNAIVVTNGSGVPSEATNIPTAITIGSAYIYRVGGTDVSVADGGTGVSSWADGQMLIGNTAGNTAALGTIAAVANQTTVTPGASSLSIGTVQSIDTTSTPQFARLGLGAAADATAKLLISHTTGDGQAILRTLDDDATDQSQLIFQKADATAGPAAIHSGDVIFEILGQGMGATAYQTGTAIKAVASENFTDVNFGTYLALYASDNTASALQEGMRVRSYGIDVTGGYITTQSGGLTIYGTTFAALSGQGGAVTLAGTTAVIQLNADLIVGNAVQLIPSSEDTSLISTNSEQSWLYAPPDIEQSGSAAYNGVKIVADEDSLGSGATGTGGTNNIFVGGTATYRDMYRMTNGAPNFYMTSNDDDATDNSKLIFRKKDASSTYEVHTGDILGQVDFQGYGATAYPTGAAIKAVAAENFTNAAAGSNLEFYTTLKTTVTPVLNLRIEDDGDLLWGSGAAGHDYSLTVDGETNDGSLTYMEDEDRWDFGEGLKAVDYYSGDGSQGMTTVLTVRDSGGLADCTITYKDGLVTETTCTHT